MKKLKITSVTCSMTRQVQAYSPAQFSMQAEVPEGADPEMVARELQRLVIRVLYKDTAKVRDALIEQIVDCGQNKQSTSGGAESEPNF